jgi:hypothetical protein
MMSIHYQGSPNNAMHLSRHLKVAGNIFLSLRPGDGERYTVHRPRLRMARALAGSSTVEGVTCLTQAWRVQP